MAAVVLFFTGLILTKFENFDISIKVPISFLLISIFGFLYAALLYSSAAQEVSEYNEARFHRAVFLGDILSEYLGVYLLVISIPLVINLITDDLFLRLVSLSAALAGLAIYQFSSFSLVERHFRHKHHFISVSIIVLGLLLFVAQLYQIYFVPLSVIFAVFILVVTYRAAKIGTERTVSVS
ncbi:MAG: hypothetical protein UY63_C0018G0017 [Parcubacteria group bacterium GW2011_GWA2_51_10]|nr:MAG: hypothetical protein UY63_C0018G0017 [Parcubacteria group bacterium GW2011_GWA2_51_10]